MFQVEEHGRDDNDQAGGCRSRRWFTYCEGCAQIKVIVRPGFKLSDTVGAQLVAGHRAE